MLDYIRNIFHIIKCEKEGKQMIDQFVNYEDKREKYTPDKYTIKELKEVVGKLPFNLWTEKHYMELNRRFRERKKRCENYWKEQNIKLNEDKTKHPEKYRGGLMQLIAYGYQDDYNTGFREQTSRSTRPNQLRSYKSLNKEDDEIDNDYKEWYYNMFDKYYKNNFSSMFS